ncbi:MAG: DUF1501 domain-containing protein [Verrucomicrobia bacterium]|nr:DUF1501 domain-containing protein [Verrucomicrobiota bacterium]
MNDSRFTRRRFLGEASCAALGTAPVLSTLLNLRMANQAAAQELGTGNDHRSFVCIYLGGGIDSFNLLVPRDAAPYTEYQAARGNLALRPDQMIALEQAAQGDGKSYSINNGAAELADMFNGTGAFTGKRRLSFAANVGTLVQPTSMDEYQRGTVSLPKALFSHKDQTEQWQTSVPQGLSELTGWAGRAADLLHSTHNGGKTAMNLSFSGNNVLQSGKATTQFVVTSDGALYFSGATAKDGPMFVKNTALKSMMEAHYDNLFRKSFAGLTRDSAAASEFFTSVFSTAPTIHTPFPNSRIAETLRSVALTIALRDQLGLRRQTFYVDYSGWDHHSELINTQATMLRELSPALAAFQLALEELNLADDVIGFTCSDFGRTLRSNGRGTDHAWGGNQFVFGTPVAGGRVMGTTLRQSGYPSLALDGPNDIGRGGRVLPTTAVDEYFGELLSWFGVSGTHMDSVLPNLRSFYDPTTITHPLGILNA